MGARVAVARVVVRVAAVREVARAAVETVAVETARVAVETVGVDYRSRGSFAGEGNSPALRWCNEVYNSKSRLAAVQANLVLQLLAFGAKARASGIQCTMRVGLCRCRRYGERRCWDQPA